VAPVGEATELSIESCRVYDGQLRGTIRASLNKKGLTYRGDFGLRGLDLERLVNGLGVEREKFYINGLAQGQVTVSGKEGRWEEIGGEFSAIPPGGILRVEDVDRFFNSLPGGKSALQRLKGRYSATEWKALVEGMNESGGILRVQNVDELVDSLPSEARKAVVEARKRAFTDQQWARFRDALQDFRYRVVTVKVTLRPLQTGSGKGYRAQAEVHLAGVGARAPFDEIDISILPTYDVRYVREGSSRPGQVTRPGMQTE